MPAKNATRQARKAQSPSAQAGEYVRQEIEHVREGKHGARSAKQVIAIGLSKARRAGVKLPPPPGKKPLQATGRKPNPTRSRAAQQALRDRCTILLWLQTGRGVSNPVKASRGLMMRTESN
jgi:hypothetical protein